jgi:hypothetical protein
MSFNLFEMFTHGVCALMPSALGTHYSFYLIYSSQLNIFNLPPFSSSSSSSFPFLYLFYYYYLRRYVFFIKKIQADNLRQQTLHQLRRILTVRQVARCFLVIGEYYGRLRALSSLWASRPRE